MAKKKTKSVYICSDCGASFTRWAGRCSNCEAWNTLEESEDPGSKFSTASTTKSGAPRTLNKILSLSEIPAEENRRQDTGLPELNQVLGGGLVAGSFLLIGGEPGVGKSTLMLEIARRYKGKIYYFSGEESAGQIKIRSERLELKNDDLFISRETDLDGICTRISRDKPALAIIDSIQTVYREGMGNLPGSVSQLKEAAMALMETCKSSMVPLIVTGHITREGSIAGPRMMEHMVDVVLYFETDRLGHLRLLRAVKNRFGPVGEVAIYEMYNQGLREPESIGPGGGAARESAEPGRVFSVLMEGSRALGVEVQALVTRSSFGQSRRMAEGIDNRRLILMSAVLEKYLRLNLAEYDIFANLAGGLTATEPAIDLALCAAILSSYREVPLVGGAAYLGEVGLSGEVRPVGQIMNRIKELANLGFKTFYVPGANKKEIQNDNSMKIALKSALKNNGTGDTNELIIQPLDDVAGLIPIAGEAPANKGMK